MCLIRRGTCAVRNLGVRSPNETTTERTPAGTLVPLVVINTVLPTTTRVALRWILASGRAGAVVAADVVDEPNAGAAVPVTATPIVTATPTIPTAASRTNFWWFLRTENTASSLWGDSWRS